MEPRTCPVIDQIYVLLEIEGNEFQESKICQIVISRKFIPSPFPGRIIGQIYALLKIGGKLNEGNGGLRLRIAIVLDFFLNLVLNSKLRIKGQDRNCVRKVREIGRRQASSCSGVSQILIFICVFFLFVPVFLFYFTH